MDYIGRLCDKYPELIKRASLPYETHMQRDDQVQNPTHFDVWEDLTVIAVMARTSTLEEFNGFCRNTALKYRLRAGKKGVGTAHQDLAKADQYQFLFNEYKHLCIGCGTLTMSKEDDV